VDSKVVHETDSGEPKSDDAAWMRLTLDTVGRTDWPRDTQGRPLYPEGFEDLARRRGQPLHPPGRDVRCIVSVGMLTEGWDCSTVTHIVGLRPFMSQLLCEQVVGRGLRRPSYEVGEDGRLTEEVAKIFGVPFEVIPLKANPHGARPPAPKRPNHVHALPARKSLEITFPRVEGYRQAIRNRVAVNWDAAPPLRLDPGYIPPEVEVKAALPSNRGRPSLTGPGKLERVDLNPYRAGRRLQELTFELATALTRERASGASSEAPPHVLFPQIAKIVDQYLRERVEPVPPSQLLDVFLSPYYGWVIERLSAAIQPDSAQGEAAELPRYEIRRGPGSTADVDFWTSRDIREVTRSHVNYVVADTAKWEQSAAYVLDTHAAVEAFVKNAGLGFAVPYLHNGQAHDYVPDFIVRLRTDPPRLMILETKGFDPIEEVKTAAAHRWVAAVNADGRHGRWGFALARRVGDIGGLLDAALKDG
jgi:type III restriction enzyme